MKEKANRISITMVRFRGYRALAEYEVKLAHLNILVGPNNSGKSTIVGAFRVLSLVLRRAKAMSPDWIVGPRGRRPGWKVPDNILPIATENIHTNYQEIDSCIEFRTSNKGLLTLFFFSEGGCIFFADDDGGHVRTTRQLSQLFPMDIQVVPVLGPLEHEEQIVSEETVRKNLMTTRASRNFRNYWYYGKEGFEEFSSLVAETWPGMEIQKPERSRESLVMFCLESRISRELYWAGFGFQIWLQLLTHISRSNNASLLVIDEPEVYLHPDVQRQLLGIVRSRDCDILLATHSTEIISEADPSEIVLIDKSKKIAKRLRDIDDVQHVLEVVGSIQNITLTRLARNKRLVFIEGNEDFVIIRRFARKIGLTALAAGVDLTPIESGGFSSWQETKALSMGFERALGISLQVAAIYDRDYYCEEQISEIATDLKGHIKFSHIHERKEMENYLLIPTVLERALDAAIEERNRRTGESSVRGKSIANFLEEITESMKDEVRADYIAKRIDYYLRKSGQDSKTITADAQSRFKKCWELLDTRMAIVPGKKVLANLRAKIADQYSVTLTDHRIVGAFERHECPDDLLQLLNGLDQFRHG